LLEKHRFSKRNAVIVIESVYSMDGDIADLRKCKELADRYDCKIILDEAHGMGVLGNTGRGLEEHQKCEGAAWIICGSFTKAFSSVGGYVCASKTMIDFLHFFASGTMFSAPMSVPNCMAAYYTLLHIQNDEIAHKRFPLLAMEANIDYFRNVLKPLASEYNLKIQSDHGAPLIALVFHNYNPLRVMQAAHELMEQGFYVAAVLFPACPMLEPRFRITSPPGMCKEEIDRFVVCLKTILDSPPSDAIKSTDRIFTELSPVLTLLT
jgi:7-keto-8-aminopelargonate synthetase-like enzyme